ncbi:MAG: 4-hydroxy-tetrahydrodipicolinate synthase, partial [Bdellovibrionota bacterium]
TLIFGSGSNDTAKTIEFSKKAQELGADALLLVVPYYNKPPQRGMVQHFQAIADAVSIPCFLYNVPGRTGISLSVASVLELSTHPRIIGIKEASGDMKIIKELKQKVPKDFVLLSGDDGTYVDFLIEGGHGVISVSSHIMPAQMIQWTEWCKQGKNELALKDIQKFKKSIDLLFMEANPIPVKKCMALMGIIQSAELRLPLVELEKENTELLKNEMKAQGLL